MNEILKPNSEHGSDNTVKSGSAPISSRTRESVSSCSELDLSALAKGFCESLENMREHGAKYRRIWLVRHFPLEKTDANDDYEKRSTADKSKLQKEQLDKLREDDVNAPADVTDGKTQEIFKCVIRQSPCGLSVALCVDSSKPTRARNKMTQEWIRQDPALIGKFHEQPEILNVTKDPDSWKNALSSHEQVRTAIGNILRTSHEGVLIGNRSLAWAFWLRAGRSYVSAKEAARRFWETGYDFIDFENGNPEKIILADAEILRITPDNAKSVMTAFIATATSEKEKASMSEALESLPLAWLQEAVNAGLAKLEAESPESYARFLFSLIESDGRKDADTQKFVFTKLVKLDGATIRLLEKKWNSKVIEWMATKNYREFVIKYFGETEEGPSVSAWMFSKSFQSKETEGLYESACQYWKARRKQKRSVDPFVRKNGDVWVIPRTWQVMKAKSVISETSEISDRLTSAIWKISPQAFEETVVEACRNGNLILSASVGKGKSIWISEFVKNAAIRWIPVRFFDARELTISRLAPGGDVFEDHAQSGAIFCFDGIDEIRDQETKTGVKDGITKLWSRCVITTRPGEYPEIPERTGTIWLERVNFRTFVETRYPEDLAKKIVDYSNSLEIGKEIKEDPLLMAFVCLLHETEWSLPSPEKIKTKSALFEAAARFVLSDHSKTTKWQDHDPKEDVDVWMRKLAEYAMEKSGGIPKTEANRYYDSHLSLLFRDDGTGNYEFVHESFYEFFLWYAITSSDSPKDFALWWKKRHFALYDGELKNIAWKNWRKNKLSTFRAIEMLVQRSENEKAENLASGFLNDPSDDPFGTSFFHGLELAWQLEKLWVGKWNELLRKWYEQIGQWTEMEVALKLSNLQTYVHRNGYPKIPEIDANVISKIEAVRSRIVWPGSDHTSEFGSTSGENRFVQQERKAAQFVPIFEWDSEFRIWTADFPVKKIRVSEESAKFKTLFSRIKEDRYEYEWNMSRITVADCAALWSAEGIRRACEYLNGLWNDHKRKRPLSHYRAFANGDSADAVDSYEDLKSKIWDELCRFLAQNHSKFESAIVLQGRAARKFLRRLYVHDPELLTNGIENVLERWKDDTRLWALSVNLLVRAYGKAAQNSRKTGYGEDERVDWKTIGAASKKLLERMGMDLADFLDDDGNVIEERLDEITETTVDSYGNESSSKLETIRKEKEKIKRSEESQKTEKRTNRQDRTTKYLPDDSEDCAILRLFPDRSRRTGQKTFLHCDNSETGVMCSLHSLLESVKSGDTRRVLKKSLSDIQTYGLEY